MDGIIYSFNSCRFFDETLQVLIGVGALVDQFLASFYDMQGLLALQR